MKALTIDPGGEVGPSVQPTLHVAPVEFLKPIVNKPPKVRLAYAGLPAARIRQLICSGSLATT